jgi:hypothetical protein
MSAIGGPNIIEDGLVLSLDAGNHISYPGSGTTWTDLSGGGNNGTLNGTVVYASTNGGGLGFDSSSDYVQLPTNSLNTNSDITLSFWIKRTSTRNTQTILSGINATGHFQIRYNVGQIQLVKSFIANMNTFSGFTSNIDVINNITITLLKSTNLWSLYVDGSFVSSFTNSQTFTTTTPVFGRNHTETTEYLVGTIYSSLVYNRTLSADEILQNYNATKGRFGL